MDQNNKKFRAAFAERLNGILDSFGYPAKQHGRQVRLAKEFDVSQKGARKWLEGLAMPRRETLVAMSQRFDIDLAVLEYGDESNTKQITTRIGRVVLTPIQEVGNQVDDRSKTGLASVPAPNNDSPTLGASIVEGSAMTQPAEPSYPHGTIIYWDTALAAACDVGDRVIALVHADQTRTFRELDTHDGRLILRPLNRQHDIIEGEFTILAKIVGRYHPE